jgi:hypothetical protein
MVKCSHSRIDLWISFLSSLFFAQKYYRIKNQYFDYHRYSIPVNTMWQDAVQACSALGAEIASGASALKLADNGFDGCNPVWVEANTRADNLFYNQTDYEGINYSTNTAQTCYILYLYPLALFISK